MEYLENQKIKNRDYVERYDLSMGRIHELAEELAVERLNQSEQPLLCKYREFFHKNAQFLAKIDEMIQLQETGEFFSETDEQVWMERNRFLYEEFKEHYDTSYCNPAYWTVLANEKDYKFGQQLSTLAYLVHRTGVYAFEYRMREITNCMELFLEIFQIFSWAVSEAEIEKELTDAFYYYYCDYAEEEMEQRLKDRLLPKETFFHELLSEGDFNDPAFLYRFGYFVSDNEKKLAKFLNEQPQEKIEKMAGIYTEGYRKGFELAGIDLGKKKTVNIRYHVGMERIVNAAVKQFARMGLEPVFYRETIESTLASRQAVYDHKMDDALVFDSTIVERRTDGLRNAYKKLADAAKVMAGPACIEAFGEEPFVPQNKEERLKYSEWQQKLYVELTGEMARITNEYQPGEERSFTIIAWPLPAIGEQFEAVFDETFRVNSLDTEEYGQIQCRLIDALDQGDAVHITGKDGNETNLTVALWQLQDSGKETNFENCLADVNIPLGEVFTSPKLTGTNGLLHVKQVYLEGLEYKNLRMEFKDGMVVRGTCDREQGDGEAYVKENILKNHDTLPMGEFAIGTNTTAYRMGKNYQIFPVMPILIAEKTGPHFAVGDTCYSMREEVKVFNPDGKEVTARENECSVLRKEQPKNAYFNCHTDITIPYDELGNIEVMQDGRMLCRLIEQGRFVLEGTKALNLE